MFCQIDFEMDGRAILSLAAGPQRFHELIEREGIIAAPYRARLHWVALEHWNAVGDAELKDLLRNAQDITFGKLPKHTRAALAGSKGVGPKTPSPAKR